MKNTLKTLTALFALTTLLLFVQPASAAEPIITNGSFETGDYTGWTIEQDSSPQTWGIASDNETIDISNSAFCYFDNVPETQSSPSLPITFIVPDGNSMAFRLSTIAGNGSFSLWQQVTLPSNATTLSFYLFYIVKFDRLSGVSDFSDNDFISVAFMDDNGNPLGEPFFKTYSGSLQTQTIEADGIDISAYAGSTVRIAVYGVNNNSALDFAVDNFSIAVAEEPSGPPGWSQGKKKGWNGESTPPGLLKKDKTPQTWLKKIKNKFKNARKGWERMSIPSGLIKKSKKTPGYESGNKYGWGD